MDNLTPADRIRDYLRKNGIKQKFVAEKIGMNVRTLSSKLNKHVRLNVDDIEKICGVLNCSPNTFLKPKKGVDEKCRGA